MMPKRILNLSDLGNKIKSERKYRKLTHADLANNSNVSRQTLINLEKGKDLNVSTLLKVLASMNMAIVIDTDKLNIGDLEKLMEDQDA